MVQYVPLKAYWLYERLEYLWVLWFRHSELDTLLHKRTKIGYIDNGMAAEVVQIVYLFVIELFSKLFLRLQLTYISLKLAKPAALK